MTRPYSSRARDAAIANDTGDDRYLLCSANGCPLRWCVDMGNGRLCGRHDKAPPNDWPSITQQILDRQADRARDGAGDSAQIPFDAEEVDAAQRRLRELARRGLTPPNGNGWAHELRNREINHGGILRSGAPMTPFQREAWRRVLTQRIDVGQYPGEDLSPDEIADRKRKAERRVLEYASKRGLNV